LPLKELSDKLVFPENLLLKHFDHVVFAFQHISKIPSERSEAVVARVLGFCFLDGHSAFRTIVSAFTLELLVMYDILPLYILSAINARDRNIRANRLMTLYFFANTFRFAMLVRITFDWSKLAIIVVSSHLLVLQDLCASHCVVSALELHFLQLLLHFFLDA